MSGNVVDFDPVKRAEHYNLNGSGIECIEVLRHLPGDLANAWKYLYRARYKGDQVTDLRKAAYYLRDQAKHLDCASTRPPERAVIDGMHIIEYEPDWRLRDAMIAALVCPGASGLETAARLIDEVVAELCQDSQR